MASLTEIRQALKALIEEAIEDLIVYDTVADVVSVPAVVIMPAPSASDGNLIANFDGAFGRGLDTWHLDLYVLVPRTETMIAQQQLDEFITGAGPTSIRELLYKNPEVGLDDGTDVNVVGVTAYGGKFNVARVNHIGAVLRLTVRTSGTA